MRKKKFILSLIIGLIFIMGSIYHNKGSLKNETLINAQTVKDEREFKAVWVTPLVGDVSINGVQAFKNEMTNTLDIMEFYGLNALIFHVRTHNNALYPSKINPKATYVSNIDFNRFDPIEWLIAESHKRGIEMHAWMNPYRYGTSYQTGPMPSSNPQASSSNTLEGKILNPALSNVKQHIYNTIDEFVERYPTVDAIHFDDYFYVSTSASPTGANDRRAHINDLIQGIHNRLKTFNTNNNRHVQFGISPTGIWKNGDGAVSYDSNGKPITTGSKTSGQAHYGDYLYADTLKWISEGWLDYILPQVYWARDLSAAPFNTVLSWWNRVVQYLDVNLYTGIGLYKADEAGGAGWYTNSYEMNAQYNIIENDLKNVKGYSIYSFRHLKRAYDGDTGRVGKQVTNAYNTSARKSIKVLPEIKTMKKVTPPRVSSNHSGGSITWNSVYNAKFYYIYGSSKKLTYSSDEIIGVVGHQEGLMSFNIKNYNSSYNYGVRALSPTNHLSDISTEEPIEVYDITYNLNGGELDFSLYRSREEMITDFLTDFYEFVNPPVDLNTFMHGSGKTSGFDGLYDGDYFDSLYQVNDKTINPSTGKFINQAKYNKWFPLLDLMDEYTYKGCPPQTFWGSKYTAQRRIKPFIQQINLWEDKDEPDPWVIIEIVNRIPFGESQDNIYYQYTKNFPEIVLPNATRENYRFLGWYTANTGGSRVTSIPSGSTGDKVFYARWEERTPTVEEFLVTFNLNYDNKYLSSQKIEKGSFALRPNDPSRKHYEFLGWYLNNKLFDFASPVNYNIDLVAKWNFSAFNVKFLDYDGTILKEEIVSLHESATAPSNPTRIGYIFTGWNKSYNNVTSDLIVQAQYTEAKYFVEFVDSNGELVNSVLVKHGDKVSEENQPFNENLIFIGWHLGNEKFNFNTPITSDIILVAWWDNLRHTVTFLNEDGTVFLTQSVEDGNKATKPLTDPKSDGRSFNSWTLNDSPYNFHNEVKSDLTLIPSWDVLFRTIRFLNYDLTEISRQTVEFGKKAIRPQNNPTRYGYEFEDWYLGDDAYNFNFAVYDNHDLIAKWNINIYEVKFLDWNGDVLSTQYIAHGSSAVPPVSPNNKPGHDFIGWSEEYNVITFSTEITAIYSAQNLIVNLSDYNGEHLDSIIVPYGSRLTKPSNPYREGYVFAGWLLDGELFDFETLLYADIDLVASWNKGGNVVTFLNYDNSIFIKQSVNDGDTISEPLNNPQREGYRFVSWQLDGSDFNFSTRVYNDITLRAKFEILVHKVRFLDDNNEELSYVMINHGSQVNKPILEPEKTGYDFLGWYLGDELFNFNFGVYEDFNLVAKWQIRVYTVIFLDWDNAVLKTEYINHGSSANPPLSPDNKDNHYFFKWDQDFTNITSNLEVKAIYEIYKYSVVFYLEKDSTLDTILVPYGAKVEEPNSPYKYGYKFKGWTLNGEPFDFETPINKEYSLYASWEINVYEVVFTNQSQVVERVKVTHGNKLTEPELELTREGFRFVGWNYLNKLYNFDDEVVYDMTLTAVWKSIGYVVTFLNDDGSPFETRNVEAGTPVTKPTTNPKKEGHEFAGWLLNDYPYIFGLPVNQNMTLTPSFNPIVHTIKFLDSNGTLIGTTTVEHGKKLVSPTQPIKEGHKFVNWYLGDIPYNFNLEVNDPLELVARWKINTYQVRFYDGQQLLKTEVVEYLKSATPPAISKKEGYIFVNWDKDYLSVTENLDISAIFSIEILSVEFRDHEKIINTKLVEYGTSAVAPTPTYREGFKFIRWDKDFSNIKEDLVVTAIYERIYFHVNFYDFYDKNIKKEIVYYGEKVNPPVLSEVEGAVFTGWVIDDQDKFDVNSLVYSNLELYAEYLVNQYKVKFLDYDETVLKEEMVYHNNPATPPKEPTRVGYLFVGWDQNYNVIKSDVNIKARYVKEDTASHVVLFKDDNGQILLNKVVNENEKVTKPLDPKKTGYTFIGWYLDNSLFDFDTLITKEIELFARYSINQYEVIYSDDKGVIATFEPFFSETINVPLVPSKLGYEGVWEIDLSDIQIENNYNIKAVYTLIDYKITYLNLKGSTNNNPLTHTILDVIQLEPLIIGNQSGFVGWYDEFDNEVTILSGPGDKVVYAKWLENEHTVTFVDYDGTVLSIQYIAHGGVALEPAVIGREHYQHTGWDKPFTNIRTDLTVNAIYEAKKYTLTFESNGGTEIEKQNIIYPTLPKKPSNPEQLGYDFVGWYLDINYKEEFSFNEPLKGNTTVYAKWEVKSYLVTFLDDLGNVIEQKTVIHGESVVPPKNIFKEHYTFVGWNHPLTNITHNENVRAIFKINEYVLSFDSCGGSIVPAVTYEYLTKPDEPLRPEKAGYDFVGWYLDKDYNVRYNFNESLKGNITIYARWLESLDDNKYISLYEKASIRYKTSTSKQGLRFSARLDKDVLNNEHGFYLIYGETTVDELRIAIKNNGNNRLFVNGKEVFKVEVKGVDEDNQFSITLTGIPEQGYLDKISVIGYVVVGGEKQFSLTPTTRSVAEVAFNNLNYGERNNTLLEIINSLEEKIVYQTNALEEIELNNTFYEYDHKNLKTAFSNDFKKVLRKDFTDLSTLDADLKEFYNDEYIKEKWSFLLDYFLSLSSNEELNLQITNIKENKTNKSLRELIYALTNFFNEQNNHVNKEVIDFTNLNNYLTIKEFNNQVFINPHNYKLYKVGDKLILPEVIDNKKGYVFDHYIIDNIEYQPLDTYIIKDKSVVIKKVYVEEIYTVTYKVDGKEFKKEDLSPLETVKVLPEPYKHQHVFVGWFDEDDKLFTANTLVTRNITLTAKFQEIKFIESIFINIDKDNYQVISHSDKIVVNLTYDYNYIYLEILPTTDYQFAHNVQIEVVYSLSENAEVVSYQVDYFKINYILNDPHFGDIF